MNSRSNNVEIKRLPVGLKARGQKLLVPELEGCFRSERPLIVFDCSELQQLDLSTVHLLLRCLERAILVNGDVKLAGMSSQAKKMLHLNGAETLFEMFETTEEAAGSYRLCP